MTDIVAGPVITLEALYGVPAQWFDMTCDVRGLTFQRGRSTGGPTSWMSRVPAGEMVLRLDNSSGRYSRFSGDGELVLGENTTIRLRCEWEGVHYGLFVGYVEGWQERWTDVTDDVELVVVDQLGVLAEQGGELEWVPGRHLQTVRARLEQLLGRAGVRDEMFYSHQGDIQCVSPLVTSSSVLDEVHQTTMSDNGVFFHEPAPILDPVAAELNDLSQWVYLDRRRFATTALALGARVPAVPVPTNQLDWRSVAGPMDRTMGAFERRAQGTVPVFTDACLQESSTSQGYRDIEWSYIAFERPSLVVVSNIAPPVERDSNGVALPPPWQQSPAQVPVSSTRHRIVSFTGLRYATPEQAVSLGGSIAVQLGQPKLEVSRLRLWPHRDLGQFGELLKLRLQDHIITVRNLVHGDRAIQILIDSLVEGINVSLVPRPEWADGNHVAEWDVSLILSPVIADIDDVVPPPPVDPEPPVDPPVVMVLAEFGASIGGGVPTTGIAFGDQLRTSYSTTGDVAEPFYVEAQNVLTGVARRLDYRGRDATAPIAGATAIADRWDGSSLVAGASYLVRVVSANDPEQRTNWTQINWPLPAPTKPTLVDQAVWETAVYKLGVTFTTTAVEWPIVTGVRYQIGLKNNHNDGDLNYAAQPIQQSNIAILQLLNSQPYSIAMRYVSGGTTSAWSAPLKVQMGNPPVVTEGPFEMLANVPWGTRRGRNEQFSANVPLIMPPANGEGDGQWSWTSKTFAIEHAGEADGFVGSLVTEMRVAVGNMNVDGGWQGPFLNIPGFGIYVSYIIHGLAWGGFEEAMISTNIPNPSWAGENAAQGHWKAPIRLGISGYNETTKDGRVGLLAWGGAYAWRDEFTDYVDWSSGYCVMYGGLEVWGRKYTATARQRNRVV
jgi:hypothetical protein